MHGICIWGLDGWNCGRIIDLPTSWLGSDILSGHTLCFRTAFPTMGSTPFVTTAALHAALASPLNRLATAGAEEDEPDGRDGTEWHRRTRWRKLLRFAMVVLL